MDILEDKLKGEKMGVQHGSLCLLTLKIVADNDYSVTVNSKIGVGTTGVCHRKGESCLNLVQRNVNVFKCIIFQIFKYPPDCTISVVSNAVDIFTYGPWERRELPNTV